MTVLGKAISRMVRAESARQERAGRMRVLRARLAMLAAARPRLYPVGHLLTPR